MKLDIDDPRLMRSLLYTLAGLVFAWGALGLVQAAVRIWCAP